MRIDVDAVRRLSADRLIGPAGRVMWLTRSRLFYAGLLGTPSVRNMGGLTIYVAVREPLRIRLGDGPWQTTDLAVVPAYVPHWIACDGRMITDIGLEPESLDMARLPAFLRDGVGAVEAPEFVRHVKQAHAYLAARGRDLDLQADSFDHLFFGGALAPRPLDARIEMVVRRIAESPSAPLTAEACAAAVHLSFSRFLHLFKQEVGVPFRSFRTWKRARSMLHYVTQDSNLAEVALDIGYPDSTHFSHSIRQIYGLKPSDIFAGSRRLELIGTVAAAPGRPS
ncbi:helix-turn-helix transcriptional regulator [Cupriavidus malaysiensis]|nr:AraC family transcriptional regulator [Cupriavidus malaysiensis]